MYCFRAMRRAGPGVRLRVLRRGAGPRARLRRRSHGERSPVTIRTQYPTPSGSACRSPPACGTRYAPTASHSAASSACARAAEAPRRVPQRPRGKYALFLRSDRLHRIIPEVCYDITVAFEDIHDLHRFDLIPEENHVILDGKAPNAGMQFRSGPSNRAWQGGQRSALLAEDIDETPPGGEAAACSGDMIEDVRQVAAC
jgi:hypothetical protein